MGATNEIKGTNISLQLEICKKLASHYEKEKARLAEEALKKQAKASKK